MNVPYSLPEAKKLCEEFQYLTGTYFDSGSATIQSVIVTPYDNGHKQRFFAYYLLLEDADAALEDYKGTLYDVTILAESSDGGLVNESLATWALKNNIFINCLGNITNQPLTSQAYL